MIDKPEHARTLREVIDRRLDLLAPPESDISGSNLLGNQNGPLRYDVTFKDPQLGFTMRRGTGDETSHLPIVLHEPASGKPAQGDLLEAVEGQSLVGALDTLDKAVKLIKGGGRPITLTFVIVPNGCYQLDFAMKDLGLVFEKNGEDLPTVKSVDRKHTISPAVSVGDIVVSVNAEELHGMADPFAYVMGRVNSSARPLSITFLAPAPTAEASASITRAPPSSSVAKTSKGKAQKGLATASSSSQQSNPSTAERRVLNPNRELASFWEHINIFPLFAIVSAVIGPAVAFRMMRWRS